MGNEVHRDGDSLSLVREPDTVEDEVVNDVLMRGFEGEEATEDVLDELLSDG